MQGPVRSEEVVRVVLARPEVLERPTGGPPTRRRGVLGILKVHVKTFHAPRPKSHRLSRGRGGRVHGAPAARKAASPAFEHR